MYRVLNLETVGFVAAFPHAGQASPTPKGKINADPGLQN